jgi:hypothetical protein
MPELRKQNAQSRIASSSTLGGKAKIIYMK